MSFIRFEALNYFSEYCIKGNGGQKTYAKGYFFSSNWHKEPEIILCKKGVASVILDDREYTVREGNIIFINSNVIHSINVLSDLSFYCFHIDSKYFEESFPDARESFFTEYIERDDKLAELLINTSKIYNGNTEQKAVRLKIMFLQLFLMLYENYKPDRIAPTSTSKAYARVKNAISYIEANLSGDLTLESIACSVGINKYQLSREFKAATKLNVFEYINIYRCKTATALLKNGASVTDAAFACGFKNLSYFSRTYKKYMSTLPSKNKNKEE